MGKREMLLWADALDSGEHKQGKHVLEKVDSGQKCCLGVACVVAMADGVVLDRRVVLDSDDREVVSYWQPVLNANGGFNEFSHLPADVMEWLGLESNNPMLPNDGEEGRWINATQANDNAGWDFPRIAAAVRKMAEEME